MASISILGLGYVGCVGIGCLARHGHRMIGVDLHPDKVEFINQGRPTIIEKDNRWPSRSSIANERSPQAWLCMGPTMRAPRASSSASA